jgi:hypothetical protein
MKVLAGGEQSAKQPSHFTSGTDTIGCRAGMGAIKKIQNDGAKNIEISRSVIKFSLASFIKLKRRSQILDVNMEAHLR